MASRAFVRVWRHPLPPCANCVSPMSGARLGRKVLGCNWKLVWKLSHTLIIRINHQHFSVSDLAHMTVCTQRVSKTGL